jgi:hypothetical protein
MQGQAINAMAPSHHSDGAYDKESQIPPWAEASSPLTQVQPTFTMSQASQFGFRLPSQAAKPLSGGTRSNELL